MNFDWSNRFAADQTNNDDDSLLATFNEFVSSVLHFDDAETSDKKRAEFDQQLDASLVALLDAWPGDSALLAHSFADVLWYRAFELSEDVSAIEKQRKALQANDKESNASQLEALDSQRTTLLSQLTRIDRLTELTVEKNIISKQIALERLEGDRLSEANLVSSARDFQRKIIRANTKASYTQQKFNLLREESEGFAKIVARLNAKGALRDIESIRKTKQGIQSLIGYFDLDPNRVFDIVLDAFEQLEEVRDEHLELLTLFKGSALCHVVGFKFQMYHEQQQSATPRTLYRLAARLLAVNALAIDALYAHLAPLDAVMARRVTERREHAQLIASKIGVISLAKSNLTPAELAQQTQREEKEEAARRDADRAADHANQKTGLLVALLELDGEAALGASRALLDVLAPFDAVAQEAVSSALAARLHALVEPLYAHISARQLGAVGDPQQAAELAARATPATALNNEALAALYSTTFPLLRHARAYLGRDVPLLAKFARLFVYHLTRTKPHIDARLREEIETIIGKVFLPALSMTKANPGIAYEMWEVLRVMNYQTRYRLYGRWAAAYAKYTPLVLARAAAANDTRALLRRISKDNYKLQGKIIGKLTQAQPIPVLEQIMSQVKSYDNLIQPIVDAFKYLSPLTSDVLSYMLLRQCSNPDQQKLQSDGTNIGRWFASLSVFTGTLYRRHSSIEIEGMLQYIVNQLHDNNSLDLVLLTELLERMGGVTIIEDQTVAQLAAAGGGAVLRVEGAPLVGVKPLRRAAKKLRDALYGKRLAAPLLVMVGQQRTATLFRNPDIRHLKMLGDLFDKAHMAFMQLCEFLSHMDKAKYVELLPPIDALMSTYRLEPAAAFHAVRPVLPYLYDDVLPSRPPDAAPVTRTAPLVASTGADAIEPTRARDKSERDDEDEEEEEEDDDAAAAAAAAAAPVEESGTTSSAGAMAVDSTLQRSLMARVGAVFPADATLLTRELYVTFWSLSLYDLVVPEAQYSAHLKRIVNDLKAADNISDRSKRAKEKDRLTSLSASLTAECKEQRRNHELVMKKFRDIADKLVSPESLQKGAPAVLAFIQHCLLPRALFSTLDARFCAEFILLMHKVDVPRFKTLNLYDKTLREMAAILFCCTESEANRVGRFYRDVFEQFTKWKSDKKLYAKECSSKLAFTKDNENDVAATHDQFVEVLYGWHVHFAKLCIKCLASGEYMQMRNTLLVLTKLHGVFPTVAKICYTLEKKIENLKNDEREDLKVLANRYHALISQTKQSNVLRDVDWFKGTALEKKYRELALKRRALAAAATSSKPASGDAKGENNARKRDDSAASGSASSRTVATASSNNADTTSTTKRNNDNNNNNSSSSSTAPDKTRGNSKPRQLPSRLDRALDAPLSTSTGSKRDNKEYSNHNNNNNNNNTSSDSNARRRRTSVDERRSSPTRSSAANAPPPSRNTRDRATSSGGSGTRRERGEIVDHSDRAALKRKRSGGDSSRDPTSNASASNADRRHVRRRHKRAKDKQ